MAIGQVNRVIQHIHKALLVKDGEGRTDGQLLDAFVGRREHAALETLVHRHGTMVLSVCRRVLGSHHDAEDAFQATFLVLVRKAASIVPKEMVANWLYGVACNTAIKAKALAARQRSRERQVMIMPEPEAIQHDRALDLQHLLDQELKRLPDKYRATIVLCELEGKTRKEAAKQLGWPEGTVAGRLARAKTMLAKRLAHHGFALSGGSLAVALSQCTALATVPASLTVSTIKAACLFAAGQATAAGAVSLKVVALTEGVLKAMLLTKLKIATAVLLVIGSGGLMYRSQGAESAYAQDGSASTALVQNQVGAGNFSFEEPATPIKAPDDQATPISDYRVFAGFGLRLFVPMLDSISMADGKPMPAEGATECGRAMQQAEKDFKVAEFYRRTGHPATANFYYEVVRRRYPGTAFADLAVERLREMFSKTDIASVEYSIPILQNDQLHAVNFVDSGTVEKNLHGTWRVVLLASRGKLDYPKDMKWMFADGKIAIDQTVFGTDLTTSRVSQGATYQLGGDKFDKASVPNGFNLTVTSIPSPYRGGGQEGRTADGGFTGPIVVNERNFDASRTFRGIYAWVDGRLIICLRFGAGDRPTAIPAEPGKDESLTVFVLEREPVVGAMPVALALDFGFPLDRAKAFSFFTGFFGNEQPDKAKIQGDWKLVSWLPEGDKVDVAAIGDFHFAGDRLTTKQATVEEISFTLDETKQPKQIVFTVKQAKEEMKRNGIYSLEGDNLKICFNFKDNEGTPPSEFTAKNDSRNRLYVLKRVKPKPAEVPDRPSGSVSRKNLDKPANESGLRSLLTVGKACKFELSGKTSKGTVLETRPDGWVKFRVAEDNNPARVIWVNLHQVSSVEEDKPVP